MLKVLIFSSMPLDQNSGSPFRGRLIADGFIRLGVVVRILSPLIFPENATTRHYDINAYPDVTTAVLEVVREFKPDFILCITYGFLNIVDHVASLYRIPFGVDLHAIRSLEVLSEKNMPISEKLQCINNAVRWELVLRKARLITVANPMLYFWISKLFSRAVPVIGMVDDAFFTNKNPKKQLQREETKVHLLYAGGISWYQGIMQFIQFVYKNRLLFEDKLHLTVACTKSVSEIETEYSVPEFISFIPAVQPADFPQLLAECDAFIIPRPLMLGSYQAFPQKLVDGMALGAVVMATDIAPHRWAITHAENGILFDVTVDGISKALTLVRDQALHARVQENARIFAQNHFSASVQCSKMVNAIANIV